MKFSSMRSAIVIASVVAGSVIPTQAFAQIDVFTQFKDDYNWTGTYISTYTFTSDMTLNSIDFRTTGLTGLGLSYQIGNDGYIPVTNSGVADSNGFQRFVLGSGLTMNNGTVVRVKTIGATNYATSFENSLNSAANVTYGGMEVVGSFTLGTQTNSNLRVSAYNPGSNVAPEPGTFALALTGGAALLGVCIRRRRNAA
jgi:hypothetical protein